MQVVDSRKFGLPQRRRRLYTLGSPKAGKAPVMRSSTAKMLGLGSFLSKRGKRERFPGNLFAIAVPHNVCHEETFDLSMTMAVTMATVSAL